MKLFKKKIILTLIVALMFILNFRNISMAFLDILKDTSWHLGKDAFEYVGMSNSDFFNLNANSLIGKVLNSSDSKDGSFLIHGNSATCIGHGYTPWEWNPGGVLQGDGNMLRIEKIIDIDINSTVPGTIRLYTYDNSNVNGGTSTIKMASSINFPILKFAYLAYQANNDVNQGSFADYYNGISSSQVSVYKQAMMSIMYLYRSSIGEIGLPSKFNTNESSLGDQTAISWSEAYENSVKAYKFNVINGNGEISNVNNRSYIGPFKIETSQGYGINAQIDGYTVEGYATSVGGSVNPISNIPNNTNFYIVVNGNISSTKINLKISKKFDGYRARLMFLCKYAYNGGSETQNYLLYKSEPTTITTELDLTAEQKYGTLKIGKFDQDTGKTLANVEFRLYNKDKNQYVKAGNSNTTFTAKASEAKIYTTNSSGEITISNLIIGNYQIQETKNPDPVYGTELKNRDVYVLADVTDTSEKIIQTTYNIIASSESINVNKSKTKQQYIQMLYTAILNRTADKDGLNTWTNVIVKTSSGFNDAVSIRKVISGLIQTEEFNTKNPNIKTEAGVNEYINRLYSKVLGRSASAFELAEHRYKAYDGYTGAGIENKKELVELTVRKIDKATGNRLGGVSFSIKMTSGEKSGKYLGYDGSGKAVYYDTEHVMYTNATKDIVIKEVYQGNYEFKEIQNPNLGYVTDVNEVVQTGTITMTSNAKVTIEVKNEKTLLELTIQKVDETTGERLGNVTFSIKMTSGEKIGKYLGYDEKTGIATYHDKEYVMTTDATKDIVIKQVYQGKYEFKEIKNSNQGYVTNVNKVVQTGNITMTDNAKITIKVTNRREYVDLSGYVWEDAHWSEGKGFVGNSLYKEGTLDANDKLVPNINVYLRKVTGTNQNEHVMNTTTDANGKYEFKNVKIDELSKYYIVFEYNGVLYKSVDEININKDNGSKAKEGTTTGGKSVREEFNSKFTTIAPGQALDANKNKTKDLKYETTQVTNVFDGSQSNESKILYSNSYNTVSEAEKAIKGYPIAGVDREYLIQSNTYAAYGGYLDKIHTADYIRKNGITKIENINQGLIERVQPSVTVGEDIYSARVEFNGESHIYEYSKRGEYTQEYTEDGIKRYGPTVKFEKGDYQQLSYVRAMYASDIKKAEEKEATLSLHVTYAIKITNGSGNLILKINQIADYFDSKYLKALSYGTTVDDKGIPQNAKAIAEDQVQSISGVTTYQKAILNVDLEIGAEKEETVYVEFEVNPREIHKVVNKEDDEVVKLDNIVEINSYSVTDENKNPYAGIFINSQPGNLKVEDPEKPENPEDATIKFNNTYECDTAYAPGLTLMLQEARSTSGKVFLDETLGELQTGKVRQGSGKYEDGEQGIKEVHVQLINKDGTLAKVYDESVNGWKDAEETTDENGEYTISGFLPGEYTIKYTWGDTEYKVQDYKSTIVDKDVWEANGENKEWYKDTETRRSDAVDDYKERQNIDKEVLEVTYATQTKINNYQEVTQTITASTKPFEVNIEYITSNKTKDGVPKTTVEDEYEIQNGITIPEAAKDGFKNRIRNIDFGIVERARQILDLNKKITNIKITLANGNTLIDTTVDENGKLTNPNQYIVYLPKSTGEDAGQVKVEIDSEIVQGATLELTYDLNVTNISEIEYATEEFYKYGDGYGKENIIKLTPSKIIDYLDNNINPEVGKGWEYVENKEELVTNYLWSGNIAESEHKDKITKVINGTSKVVTTEVLGKELAPGESTNGGNGEITIVGYKLLSNNEETVLENNAEIIQVKKTGGATLKTTPGNYIPGETPTQEREPDDATSERLSIIPPTGNGLNYISYIIITISALGVVGIGIILIKKYVLKK